MGTGNIPAAVDDTLIPPDDHNSLRSAFVGDVTPRNSSGNAEDEAGSSGTSAYRWLQGFIKTLFIGSVADNISIEADSSDMIVKVGGTERMRVPVEENLLPPGMVSPYSGSADPAGTAWFICDGRELNRITYSRLFTAIGSTHGEGNGTTTFNIPDYRGRFLRGVDAATARDPDAAGRTAMGTAGNTGDNVGSIQTDAFKSHTHDNTHGDVNNGGTLNGAKGQLSGFITVTNTPTGGNETRPINAYVNFIIKT